MCKIKNLMLLPHKIMKYLKHINSIKYYQNSQFVSFLAFKRITYIKQNPMKTYPHISLINFKKLFSSKGSRSRNSKKSKSEGGK